MDILMRRPSLFPQKRNREFRDLGADAQNWMKNPTGKTYQVWVRHRFSQDWVPDPKIHPPKPNLAHRSLAAVCRACRSFTRRICQPCCLCSVKVVEMPKKLHRDSTDYLPDIKIHPAKPNLAHRSLAAVRRACRSFIRRICQPCGLCSVEVVEIPKKLHRDSTDHEICSSSTTKNGHATTNCSHSSVHAISAKTINSEHATSCTIHNSMHSTSEKSSSYSKSSLFMSCKSSSDSMHSALLPLTLESLTFHRVLRKGEFGLVLLASSNEMDQPLAVKVVSRKKLTPKEAFVERHIHEVVSDSRFFTCCLGSFQTEDHIFIAMEYLMGGTLNEFIRTRAPLDTIIIRFISAEILCGLQFLHERGIMHRNINPCNIILDSVGHAKITEFGLALTNIRTHLNLMNRPRARVGHKYYMAPEVIADHGYECVADYFSFGIIVYGMATKELPFNFKNGFEALIESILCDSPVYPEDIDTNVQDFIDKLLIKDPALREHWANSLREHPLFEEMNWDDLEAGKVCPPFTMEMIPPVNLSTKINLENVTSQE